jgi:choline transport protein
MSTTLSSDPEKTTPSISSPESLTDQIVLDGDALKLAEMGYTQDMRRNFSVWSVLGVGFSLTNSWFGISAALVTGINSGGPALLIYGIIAVFLVSICVGVSLSELASAMPNAGGQYYWANELASKRYANFASYLTGWFAWAGAIFTSAAVAIAMGSATVGCWQLTHPDLYVFLDFNNSPMLNFLPPLVSFNSGMLWRATSLSMLSLSSSTVTAKYCPP